MTRVHRERLGDRLARELAAEIAAGSLPVGAQLPSESQLCERFSVSRAVVREAISGLKAEGLVVARQGVGVFVRPSDQRHGFRIDQAELETAQELVQLLDLRIAVEAEAAALAARARTLDDLSVLAEACAVMRAKIATGEDAADEDAQFHRAVSAATGNHYFRDLYGYLGPMIIPRARLNRFRQDEAAKRTYLNRLADEHDEILDAIRRQDSDGARAAMRMHLGRSREALRRLAATIAPG